MKSFHMTQRGKTVLEYAVLIMIVLGALYVMKPYVQRVINGMWKKSGDSFGVSRQYQPGKTQACAFSLIDSGRGVWYDNDCFKQAITLCAPGNVNCENDQKLVCAQGYCCEEKATTAGIQTNCN